MPKKKSTAIVPLFSNQKKGLLTLKAGLEFGISQDEKAQELYRQDHLLNLEEEIKSLSHAKEQIAYLKAFRDLLSGPCLQKNGPVTIIHCSELWKTGKCRFKECETRKKWKSLFL